MTPETEELNRKLLAFLSGNADSETHREVEEWVRQSPAHLHRLRRLQRAHTALYCASHLSEIKGDFRKFNRRLSSRVRPWHYLGWAAAVLLLVGAAWGVVRFYLPGELSPELFSEILPPGKPQAVFYYSEDSLSIYRPEYIPVDAAGYETESRDSSEWYYQATGPAAASGVPIRIYVPRGAEFKVILSDGTRVWLNSESELSFPEIFGPENRKVTLSGEAYFEVAANAESPFIVSADKIQVRVTGTVFNIQARREGYVETVLVEGTVGIWSQGNETRLHPNQLAIYDVQKEGISVKEVDTWPYVSWRSGYFTFYEKTLGEIMEELALWYDLEITFDDPALKEIRSGGSLRRHENGSVLFRYFEKIFPIRFVVEDRSVRIEERNK